MLDTCPPRQCLTRSIFEIDPCYGYEFNLSHSKSFDFLGPIYDWNIFDTPPPPCRGRAPSILISLFFEKIRKFQILCDSLEFLKILLFLTPFSLNDPTLTPPLRVLQHSSEI